MVMAAIATMMYVPIIVFKYADGIYEVILAYAEPAFIIWSNRIPKNHRIRTKEKYKVDQSKFDLAA